MRFLGAEGPKRSRTPLNMSVGEGQDGAISGCPADGEDLSGVSTCGQRDLLVAPARANWKQAHSHPSWLERNDAALLQSVDELGQVRKQRSRQCLRLPTTFAAELDDDGSREERTASSVPKSASADTTIRCSAAARSKITSSSACWVRLLSATHRAGVSAWITREATAVPPGSGCHRFATPRRTRVSIGSSLACPHFGCWP